MQIYTVVDVQQGVAVGAKSFPNPEDAKAYLRILSNGRNLDEDDLQVFEDSIAFPTSER